MADRHDERQPRAQAATQIRSDPSVPTGFGREKLGQSSSSGGTSGHDKPSSAKRKGLLAGVVAAGVVAAMATTWFMGSAPQGDAEITASQQAARQATFQARGPLTLPEVPAAEQAQAIASMNLPAGQQASLTQDLARDDTALIYLTVWDDYAEDGDVITIDSNGFTRTVSLTKAPQRFAVPVKAGTITLHGIRDGGGGITLGAQADGGPVLVPVMQPGQSVDVPVALP